MNFSNEKELLLKCMEYSVDKYFSEIEHNLSLFHVFVKTNISGLDNLDSTLDSLKDEFYKENSAAIQMSVFSKIETSVRNLNGFLSDSISVYKILSFLENETQKIETKEVKLKDKDNDTL